MSLEDKVFHKVLDRLKAEESRLEDELFIKSTSEATGAEESIVRKIFEQQKDVSKKNKIRKCLIASSVILLSLTFIYINISVNKHNKSTSYKPLEIIPQTYIKPNFIDIPDPTVYLQERSDVREKSFTNWQHLSDSQVFFEQMSSRGKMPLITEVSNDGWKRRIYIKKMSRSLTRSHRTKQELLGYHKNYLGKGYRMLTLTIFKDDLNNKWYSSTWVPFPDLEKYNLILKNFGLRPLHSQQNLTKG